jgi:hypothetical protein
VVGLTSLHLSERQNKIQHLSQRYIEVEPFLFWLGIFYGTFELFADNVFFCDFPLYKENIKSKYNVLGLTSLHLSDPH